MKKFKALVFDVGGSVFDWKKAVRGVVEAEAKNQDTDIDSELFAMDWRRQLFIRLTEVRKGELEVNNVEDVLSIALEDIADNFPSINLSVEVKENLLMAWHQMPAFGDFPEALERLKKQYKVVVLSVLSFAIVVDSSKYSGISWDGIISCEFLDYYKPDAGAYLAGCKLLGLKPEEVCMVAVHPGDLLAANRAGLGMAMVKPQLREPDIPGLSLDKAPENSAYDFYADDFASLVEQMC